MVQLYAQPPTAVVAENDKGSSGSNGNGAADEPMPTQALAPGQRTADDEYAELLRMLDASDGERAGDVYAQLLAKERDVLEVLNRVAVRRAEELRAERAVRSLINTPVRELFHRFCRSLRDIFADVVALRSLREVADLPWLLLDGERKVHVGIVVVLAALALFFADAAA